MVLLVCMPGGGYAGGVWRLGDFMRRRRTYDESGGEEKQGGQLEQPGCLPELATSCAGEGSCREELTDYLSEAKIPDLVAQR